MRRVKQRTASGRLRRPLAPIAVALVALAAAGAAAAATKWPTASQEIATSGINSSIKFCGTKPITLAVEDGFGVNAWSQESYAAVKSTAAQCKNVKVITAAGGGVAATAISDINSAVAQGANAMTVIPDFGSAELPAIQAATKAGVKVVPWGADPGGTNGVRLRRLRRLERRLRRHAVGAMDGQGAARPGQRDLHGRPGGQPGRRRPAGGDRQGVRQLPGDAPAHGRLDLAGHQLGSGDGRRR